MPGVNLVVGDDGSNTLSGTSGKDLIYGFDPNGPEGQVSAITATRVAAGLSQPDFVVAPPGDTDRLFIVERTGDIKILDLNSGHVLATPFLDLTSQVNTAGEGGLLGLAFDPNYATNGFFYVDLINTAGDTEVRRYHVSANGNIADPASANPVISIDQPAGLTNHKAGWIAFGPDGDLYVATGDGGGGGDPLGSGQDINSLLGKMLRLDVHGDAFPSDPTRNYAIPADNMFASTAGADEIYALGLRNPFRDSFDRGTGDFYIGDVGQDRYEEIDIGQGGANYGWNVREGPVAYAGGTISAGTLTDPIYYYDHTVGHAIIGGYVYRGQSDGLQGQYFFADEVNDKIFTLRFNGTAWVATDRTSQVTTDAGAINNPDSFGEDGRGNLYVVDLDGDVFRLTPIVASADQADTLRGFAGDDMLFGGAGNDLLDGGPGADTLNGGAGIDTATYASSPSGVTVNLETSHGSGGDAAGDILTSIENLIGSAFPDTFVGDGGINVFTGGGSADVFVFDAVALAGVQGSPLAFDRITDYNQGNSGLFSSGEGDQIDLSALLATAYNHGSGQAIGALVRVVASGIGASLQVDTDGAANGTAWTTIARLDGVHAGASVNVILDASLPAGSPVTVQPSLAGNFDGDSHGDILFQNTDGTPAVWLMNGTGTATFGNSLSNPGSAWHEIDAADFNDDGRADILWQNADGTPAVWLMNGTGVSTFGPGLHNPGASWHEIAAADFDGDGKSDILWQNADGTPAVWLMNGIGVTTFGNSLNNPGSSWHEIAAADFDGDGRADILWQNADGTPAVWLMNGTGVTTFGPGLHNPGSSWHEIAAADFDGDGHADILWQNADGTPAVWLMNGTGVTTFGDSLHNPGTAWHIVGAADFNGDGKADIVWQNTDGTPAVWLMNGTTVDTFGPSLHDPGSSWHIV